MNERIRELAEQAELWNDMEPTRREGRYVGHMNVSDVERFAELIVKECATFIDSHEQIDKYGEAQDTVYGKDLLQHFGVEE